MRNHFFFFYYACETPRGYLLGVVRAVLTLLGLKAEEQGVATWFIGPGTINMTSCIKKTSLELGPELRYVLGRC
jgi:hypothetical protein